MREHLICVDRQAWPLWERAAECMSTEPEVGEGWRVVRCAALPSTELLRAAIPLKLRCAADDTARVQALLAESGALGLRVFTLRRHGRFAAAKIAALMPQRDVMPDAPCLYVGVGDRELFAGVATPRSAGFPRLGFTESERTSDGLSRARHKLVESFERLTLLGYDPRRWTRWLELGAFPGGMTAELAQRGAQVHAVDLAPPTASMSKLPGVTCVVADIYDYALPVNQAFDAILCDVNGPPLRAARAVARLAKRHLQHSEGLVVLTIKLPRWDSWPTLKPRLEAALRAGGLRSLTIFHGRANRQELTWLGHPLAMSADLR